MAVKAYLRASTEDQDADRARDQLSAFAEEHGVTIAAYYTEYASGSSLERPALFRLLRDASPGDVLLVEQVDRLSRLNAADWQRLRTEIDARHIRIVAYDLPTSWEQLGDRPDDFTARVFAAINSMMLDVLAAVARKDLEDRKRRQLQGQAKAKAEGKYRGRPENVRRNAAIASMLRKRATWSEIIAATGCSRGTIAKIAKREKQV